VTPEEGLASGPRLAWLGHATGNRADGLSSYSEQVAGGLQRRGFEVMFHHAAGDGPVVPGHPREVVSWPTWKFKTVTLPRVGFRPAMASWLESRRPQLLHCSLSMTLDDGWVGQRARRLGSATVVTFHLPFGRQRTARAVVMRELHRFWAGRLSSYQRVIVFNQDHRERLARVGVPRERLRVVPNAVDLELFAPGDGVLRAERLAGADLVIGYLGRLDPEKGIRPLLEAFQKAALGPSARLLVAGDGVLRPLVERAAAHDPRIVNLGRLVGVPARADFWRSIDLFCLPSTAEGLSIAMLEAMATGRPVAVTKAGGLSDAGAGAFELDASRLRNSLAGLLQEVSHSRKLLEEKGLLARSEAVRHHGIESMLDRLLEIYSELGVTLPAPRPERAG
jgi:glycosyltransferase involved in cell wall biosynthesis